MFMGCFGAVELCAGNAEMAVKAGRRNNFEQRFHPGFKRFVEQFVFWHLFRADLAAAVAEGAAGALGRGEFVGVGGEGIDGAGADGEGAGERACRWRRRRRWRCA